MNKYSPNPDDTLKLARKHAKAGHLAEASALYERVLSRSPQNKKARKELKALQTAAAGQIERAPLEAQLKELVWLHANRQLDQAISKATRISDIYPDQPLPYNIIGVILAGRNQHAAAINNYTKALAIAPNYPDAQYNLGISLNAVGRPEDAISCFRTAISLRPDDPDSHFHMANALRLLGKLSEAVESYEKAISIRSFFAEAHVELGATLITMGKSGQAIVSFEKCLKVEPIHVKAHEYMGDAFVSLGSFSQAISWYRDAVELEPDRWEIYQKIGIALLSEGDREGALENLQQSLDMNPDNSLAKHFVAVAKNDVSTAATSQYVAELFDGYAATFDWHLVDVLGYRAPELLRSLVVEAGMDSVKFKQAIDLGCGTGLSGSVFRDLADKLAGIDLSEKMIAQAREKCLYDTLHNGAVIDVLNQLDTSFDLFICADMLVYVSNMDPLLQAIRNHSAPGAVFVFSTETPEKDRIELRPSGRYAHAREYVVEALESAGFRLISDKAADIRKERGAWIKGGSYLARLDI